MKNRNRAQRCFAVLSSVSVTGAGSVAAVIWSTRLGDTGDVSHLLDVERMPLGAWVDRRKLSQQQRQGKCPQ